MFHSDCEKERESMKDFGNFEFYSDYKRRKLVNRSEILGIYVTGTTKR